MNKRNFLRTAGLISIGTVIFPLYQCQGQRNSENDSLPDDDEGNFADGGEFTLPKLGFSYTALAPNIDSKTMEIHYSKHHKGYVEKLNKAVEQSNYENKSLEEILNTVSDNKKDNDLRNNAGGHFNHSLFWEILLPGGSNEPKGNLLSQINKDFGSFEKFQSEFAESATEVFGSGWAWLCLDDNQNLFIQNTSNQDNPLMKKIVTKTGTPILCIDVWEHAYYLKYQNERKRYITNFMKVINWDVVSHKFEE